MELTEIQQELSHAGEDPEMRLYREKLEKHRITYSTEIPQRSFLFKLYGIPCFPRGELVALTGKEKCGKTFVSSMLMTSCVKSEVLTVRRNTVQPLHVLWYDTEQSEESTQEILKERIMRLIGEDDAQAIIDEYFSIFNVRSENWQERLPILQVAMRECHPDLVILDGVRDLVNDINDGVMAQQVMESLMQLASDCSCCIVCILHQNKSVDDKSLRGFLGSELAKKAFEVYECLKDADRIFSFHQTATRKYDILDTLRYTVNQAGLPEICSLDIAKNTTQSYPSFNPVYVTCWRGKEVDLDLKKLFNDIMVKKKPYREEELCKKVMEAVNIVSYPFAQKQMKQAVANKVITTTFDGFGKRVYMLNSAQMTLNWDDPPF